MSRGARIAAAAAAALGGVAALAGCGSGSNSAAPPPATSAGTTVVKTTAAAPAKRSSAGGGACLAVPAQVNRAIMKQVVLDGATFVRARASRASAAGQYYYVSAAVRGSGTHHLLATWVTHDLSGHAPIYSVDANAAMISQFGASTEKSLSLSIDAPAATRSRRCVDGPRATLGVPAPMGGGGAPAGQ